MKYTRVVLDTLECQLAPIVVTSDELEARLEPLYARLHIPKGQLAALSGIQERRWWEAGFPPSLGAAMVARKALAASSVRAEDLDVLIYGGVCRDELEPATACHVAAEIGVGPGAAVLDISNACLGVLSGIVDLANRIELGQVRAGMVVSCESAREIVEQTILDLVDAPDMDHFRLKVATLTGGSGAVAVILTDGSFTDAAQPRLLGGVHRTAPQHHNLCRWGWGPSGPFMETDAVAVLSHGVELGKRTWDAFLAEMGWSVDDVDRVICHQVGAAHQSTILAALGIPAERDYSTFAHLGNMGTAALPATAALAARRGLLASGQNVGFLGIGSGLNCLMLGWRW